MTTPENTPRKSKTARLGLILGIVVILAAVAALSIYLIGKRQERVAIEVMHILETETYVSPTPTVTMTPSATPTATPTPVPSATPKPPIPTLGPTYTPPANKQLSYPTSFKYQGDPYEIMTDGVSVWISYPERQLIEKYTLTSGDFEHRIRLPYSPSTLLPANGFLWVVDADDNLIHQLDAESGEELLVFQSVSSGKERDSRLFWDETNEKLWVINNAIVTRFDGYSGEWETQIFLRGGIRDMEIFNGKLYFLIYETLSVKVIDASTLIREPELTVCAGAHNLTRVGGSLWITCYDNNDVIEIDMESMEMSVRANMELSPTFSFTNGEELLILVTNLNLVPFNMDTGEVSETLILPFHLHDFLWVGDIMWMGNRDDEVFQIYDFGGNPYSVVLPVPLPLPDTDRSG